MRVALASALAAAGTDADEPILRGALARAGVAADVRPWDGDQPDWSAYDLVVLRSTWDYPERLDAFLAWIDRVAAATRLANPPNVVRANTDKRYLAALAAAGVPTVPTTFLAPGETFTAPTTGPFVVKPAVSAGSRDTIRCAPDDEARARSLVQRLHARGKTVMVQPYVRSVDARGETAMIFIDGRWSHAVRKGPLLVEGADPVEGLYAPEDLRPRRPTPDEQSVAGTALEALEAATLLYARVDLVEGERGRPMVLEVELTEPSLFLRQVPVAADRFARAIARAAEPSAKLAWQR